MVKAIIESLIDDSKSLNSALLKGKVLAYRLGNADLENWVTKESEGYKSDDVLPSYRIGKANTFCSYTNGNYIIQENQPIPITFFDEKWRSVFLQFRIENGVMVLENDVKQNPSKYLAKLYGTDYDAQLSRMLEKNGFPYYIVNVRTMAHISIFNQALSEIRTKYLTLMLEVEKKFPDFDKNLGNGSLNKENANNQINLIMSQINISTTGDGNVVTSGNNNQINAKVKIAKGDLDELKKSLKGIGIEDGEIQELINILPEENHEDGKIGKETSGWIQKMIGKTLDGTWQISTGTAAGILTELIKGYLGF